MAIPKWMQEDMGFSADEQKALDPLFTDERVKKLEAGHLRQADYSKQMNDLKKAQTDLQAANDRLSTEMAEWATVQASGREVTAKMQRDLETAQGNAARLTARVQKIATDAGLDPAKALEGIDQVVPDKRTNNGDTPPIDTSKFVSTDDFATQQSRLARVLLRAPAEIAAIQHEHHELTGEWLDARPIIDEIEKRATTKGNALSLEIRDVWQEKHNIPTLRETKAKEKYDADIKAAEARGRQEALTSLSVPGAGNPPTHGRPSPVLHSADGSARKSVLERPQPGTSTQSAVSALRSGKYRQPAQTAPAGKTA